MIVEGSRVKIRPESKLAQQHTGLAGVVGIVGAIVQGRRWSSLEASDDERQRDRAAHVRFRSPPVVLMSVPVGDLEIVDHLDPALRVDG